MSIDSLKIDYHLSYYRSSSDALVNGINNPQEFARQETCWVITIKIAKTVIQ